MSWRCGCNLCRYARRRAYRFLLGALGIALLFAAARCAPAQTHPCCARADGSCYTALGSTCGIYGTCPSTRCAVPTPTPTPRPGPTPTPTPGPQPTPTPATAAPQMELRDGSWYITVPYGSVSKVYVNGKPVTSCTALCQLLRFPLPAPCPDVVTARKGVTR